MHTLEDWGVGERCFRGLGEADLERRDRLYLFRDRDRDELLPLLLLLLLLLLEDLAFLAGPLADGDADFLESDDGFFLSRDVLPLDALLLREELPDELERLEPEELEREPELDRLELLLPDDELLQGVYKDEL